MDNLNQTSTPQTQPPIINPKPKMAKMWKILIAVLAIIILGALVAGAYYFGTQKSNQAVSPTTTPTTKKIVVTVTPKPTSTPSASKVPSKSVEAGQSGIGIFLPYKIQVPDDWTSKHESTKDVLDVLTLTKGSNKIEIRQAGGEGSKCLYGNEPEEMFTQKYKTYVEFQSLDEDWRRSGESGGTGWTLCHKTNDGWGFPSNYGYISYTVPASATDDTLKEMDSIIASITKQ